MTTETTKIEDGLYFLHAEGCCWIGALYSNGQFSTIEEPNADTHAAANDHFSGMVPSEDDIEVADIATAAQIVRDVMGKDILPEMVIVTRAAN